MLLLAVARRLVPCHQDVAAGRWQLGHAEGAPRLRGRTLGLIGCGRIGTAMAKLTNVSREEVQGVITYFTSSVETETSVGVGTDEFLRKVLVDALGQDKASSIIDRINIGRSTKGLEALKWMDARAVAERILRFHHSPAWRGWSAQMAELADAQGHMVDQVVVTFFEQPRSYTAEDVVVATGSEPIVPPVPGLRELEGIWTNREATGMKSVPRRSARRNPTRAGRLARAQPSSTTTDVGENTTASVAGPPSPRIV